MLRLVCDRGAAGERAISAADCPRAFSLSPGVPGGRLAHGRLAMSKELEEGLPARDDARPEAVEVAPENNLAPEAVEAEQAEPVGEPQVQEGPEPRPQTVPLAALDEERMKRREMQAEVEALRMQVQQLAAPKTEEQPLPDFWEDPERHQQTVLDRRLNPLQQQMQERMEAMSRSLHVSVAGEDKVAEAEAALRDFILTNRAAGLEVGQRIRSAPDPYGQLLRWHGEQRVRTEIGSDPEAYREKLKAEILAEMQAAKPASAPVMPSNLASRSAAPRKGPEWSGPRPLEDIFGER